MTGAMRPARPSFDAQMAARHPLRILLAEDNAVNQKLALRLLAQMGDRADVAGNGLEAVQAVERQGYDVVLMDWNMPNMTGIEFLAKLRALPNGHETKVVFCTTENDMSFIQRALETGADEYIMKPFDADIIETKFKQVGLI